MPVKRQKSSLYLWQRGNGIFYIRGTHNGVDIGMHSTGTRDRQEAEAQLDQFVAGLDNPAPPDEVTLNAIIDGYLTDREAHGIADLDRQVFAAKQLRPFFGNLEPRMISNETLRRYARHRTVSNGTILRELRTLRAAMAWAAGEQWIQTPPKLRMPVTAPKPKDRWITKDEAARLISECKSPHMQCFVVLALTTAARTGAILDLTWDRVDLENGIIDYGEGRGNKRRASVPINDRAREALEMAAMVRRQGCPYVIQHRGKRIESIKAAFKRLTLRADLPDVTPHTLRHTAATWMAQGGAPMERIAQVLGDTVETVERVYAHHHPQFAKAAVAHLDF